MPCVQWHRQPSEVGGTTLFLPSFPPLLFPSLLPSPPSLPFPSLPLEVGHLKSS